MSKKTSPELKSDAKIESMKVKQLLKREQQARRNPASRKKADKLAEEAENRAKRSKALRKQADVLDQLERKGHDFKRIKGLLKKR